MAEALEENTALQSLYLYCNQVSDDGATALAEALKANTALQALYLRSNNILEDGSEALEEARKALRVNLSW